MFLFGFAMEVVTNLYQLKQSKNKLSTEEGFIAEFFWKGSCLVVWPLFLMNIVYIISSQSIGISYWMDDVRAPDLLGNLTTLGLLT